MKAVKYLAATLLLTLSFSTFAGSNPADCLEKNGEGLTDNTTPKVTQIISAATGAEAPKVSKVRTAGDDSKVINEN